MMNMLVRLLRGLGRLFAIPTLFGAVKALIREPSARALLFSTWAAVAGGTWFYHRVEDLSWVDSLYLTVMTLTTVGYGDVSPQTRAGRLFTTFYVLVGVGLVAATVAEVARMAVHHETGRRASNGTSAET